MCAWAEDRGALLAVLSEHHGTADRHLPSPLILAAAIASRTDRLPILVAALVLPFYDPVRLAEDISVLDIISRGRVAYVLGVGHRPEEYEHFGIDMRRRGSMADERLATLRRLLSADSVNDGCRSITVTPSPSSAGGPQLVIGGGSTAAARRAGRFGLGLIAQAAAPGMQEAYEDACREAGNAPSFVQLPDPDAPTAMFVADDVDRSVGRTRSSPAPRRDDCGLVPSRRRGCGEHQHRAHGRRAACGHGLPNRDGRAGGRPRATGRVLPLLPLCGGVAPAVAWPYLERAADAVAAARA